MKFYNFDLFENYACKTMILIIKTIDKIIEQNFHLLITNLLVLKINNLNIFLKINSIFYMYKNIFLLSKYLTISTRISHLRISAKK